MRSLLGDMEHLYVAASTGDSVYREWRDRLVTLGKAVRITSGETIREGIAESVEPDGTLLLRLPDGSLLRVLSGDVSLREQKEQE